MKTKNTQTPREFADYLQSKTQFEQVGGEGPNICGYVHEEYPRFWITNDSNIHNSNYVVYFDKFEYDIEAQIEWMKDSPLRPKNKIKADTPEAYFEQMDKLLYEHSEKRYANHYVDSIEDIISLINAYANYFNTLNEC